MSNEKQVKIINSLVLARLDTYLLIPIGEDSDSLYYEASSLSDEEDSLEAEFEFGDDNVYEGKSQEAKNQPATLLDTLASQTAEKLLKLPKTLWPRELEKEVKRLSKLKGFNAGYFRAKVTAMIH